MRSNLPPGEYLLVFRNAEKTMVEVEGLLIEKLLRDDPDIYEYLTGDDDGLLQDETTGDLVGVRIRAVAWLEYLVRKGAPPAFIWHQEKMLKQVAAMQFDRGMVMFAEPKATA